VIALINAAAGLVGGLTSAYVINNRSLLSEAEAEVVEEEAKNVEVNTNRRGSLSSYLGNALLGFVAAGVFWAGYGTYSALDVTGTGTLTYISLATAFFIGMGGTKWLQSERDKGRWQAAEPAAALAKPDPQLQLRLSLASSVQAAQIAVAAAFKGRSPGGSRTGGTRAPNRGAGGPAESPAPREDTWPAPMPPGQEGDGAHARAPARRSDAVRTIGRSPEQAGSSG
jgi:hypothetical protein